MNIIKHYKITNWCNYKEIDSLPAISFTCPSTFAYPSTNGYVDVEQWLNDETGEGYETRTFRDVI